MHERIGLAGCTTGSIRRARSGRLAGLWWSVVMVVGMALLATPAGAATVVSIKQLPARLYTVVPGDSPATLAWRLLGHASCESSIHRWLLYSGATMTPGAAFRVRPVQMCVRAEEGDTWASLAAHFRGVLGNDAAKWLAHFNAADPAGAIPIGSVVEVPPAVGDELGLVSAGPGSTLSSMTLLPRSGTGTPASPVALAPMSIQAGASPLGAAVIHATPGDGAQTSAAQGSSAQGSGAQASVALANAVQGTGAPADPALAEVPAMEVVTATEISEELAVLRETSPRMSRSLWTDCSATEDELQDQASQRLSVAVQFEHERPVAESHMAISPLGSYEHGGPFEPAAAAQHGGPASDQGGPDHRAPRAAPGRIAGTGSSKAKASGSPLQGDWWIELETPPGEVAAAQAAEALEEQAEQYRQEQRMLSQQGANSASGSPAVRSIPIIEIAGQGSKMIARPATEIVAVEPAKDVEAAPVYAPVATSAVTFRAVTATQAPPAAPAVSSMAAAVAIPGESPAPPPPPAPLAGQQPRPAAATASSGSASIEEMLYSLPAPAAVQTLPNPDPSPLLPVQIGAARNRIKALRARITPYVGAPVIGASPVVPALSQPVAPASVPPAVSVPVVTLPTPATSAGVIEITPVDMSTSAASPNQVSTTQPSTKPVASTLVQRIRRWFGGANAGKQAAPAPVIVPAAPAPHAVPAAGAGAGAGAPVSAPSAVPASTARIEGRAGAVIVATSARRAARTEDRTQEELSYLVSLLPSARNFPGERLVAEMARKSVVQARAAAEFAPESRTFVPAVSAPDHRVSATGSEATRIASQRKFPAASEPDPDYPVYDLYAPPAGAS